MLNAILLMIGYYVVILTVAMILIVAGILIFKALSQRQRSREAEPALPQPSRISEDADEELAAAIAAVSVVAVPHAQASVSGWMFVERRESSPWVLASRSRRVSPVGG